MFSTGEASRTLADACRRPLELAKQEPSRLRSPPESISLRPLFPFHPLPPLESPMSVRIITDSGCDLSPEVADSLGIAVVPLEYPFRRDRVHRSRGPLARSLLRRNGNAQKNLPETAAPSPGAFAETFQRLADDEGATSDRCGHVVRSPVGNSAISTHRCHRRRWTSTSISLTPNPPPLGKEPW